MMKERFSKLLLGEDMSGGGKGVCTALAISNAITNLSATIFGQLWRLEPLAAEKKLMWRREMEWFLCVSDYIVELIPACQNFPDGSSLEVMVSRPRSDLYINLPALRKLDTMLLEALDSFRDTEFWYVDQGVLAPDTDGCGQLRRPPQRQEDKWWLPIPRVPPCGLSDNARKCLQHQRECTNQIAASVFGELWRLEPLASQKISMGHREMEWLLCVSDSIVELISAWRDFPQDVNDDGCGPLRRPSQRQEEKWWLPTPRVPPNGLSDNARKRLQHHRECTNQILKAAMAINSHVLSEMEVPNGYLETLPKNGKGSLGDIIYRYITAEQFSPDCLLDCLDLSSEHHTLEIANRIEAAIHIWQRKRNAKDNRSNSKSSWGMVKDLVGDAERRELLAERAESLLISLKLRFPGLSQTILDMNKIQYNKDVGQSILESYSRVLESLAFNIIARIDDLLYVDDLTKNSDSNQCSSIPLSVSSRGVIAPKRVSMPFSVPPSSNTPYATAFATPNFSPTPLVSPGRTTKSTFVSGKANAHSFTPVNKVLSDYLGGEIKSTDGNTKESARLALPVSKEMGKYWSYTENLGSRKDLISPPTRD